MSKLNFVWKIKQKMSHLFPIRGQNSSIVTTVDVNINNNNNTNNNNVNDEDFVTSTSSNSDSSNNVVSVTTPSFLLPEITLPSCAFSPCFQSEESSYTPPHSPSFDDDDCSNLLQPQRPF
jgi:hypothetical protein